VIGSCRKEKAREFAPPKRHSLRGLRRLPGNGRFFRVVAFLSLNLIFLPLILYSSWAMASAEAIAHEDTETGLLLKGQPEMPPPSGGIPPFPIIFISEEYEADLLGVPTKARGVYLGENIFADKGGYVWESGTRKANSYPFFVFSEGDFSKIHNPSEEGKVPTNSLTSRNYPFQNGRFLQGNKLYKEIQAAEDPRGLPPSMETSSEEMEPNAGYSLVEAKKIDSSPKPSPDWKGIGIDTAFYVGYQLVIALALYYSPESVSKWTKEQRNTTLKKWEDNVGTMSWDDDDWWINYIGHPYFGAISYIRARERGFSTFQSFWYSALLSTLYEYGIEAFFERPSIQDMIVTPVWGTLLGRFIFEPVRGWVKDKDQWRWYDHLVLILTDPLGATNWVMGKIFGIEALTGIVLYVPQISFLHPNSYENPWDPSQPRLQNRGLPSSKWGLTLTFEW
jgi:hypothetical protein